MNQQSPIQPIYRTSHHFVDGSIIKEASSLLSSTRSPTTVVFAVDELSNVFRVADDNDDDVIERRRQNDEGEGIYTTTIRRSRPLITPSFTTDGELSTFSEDTDEANSEDVGVETSTFSSSDDESSYPAMLHRQRSAPLQSIFRPVMSGMKRRSCDVNSEDDDADDDDHYTNYLNNSHNTPTKKKRSCYGGAPLLCHANPIGSNDGYDEYVDAPSSPFKRICNRGDTTAANEYTTDATTSSSNTSSPYTALFQTLASSRSNTAADSNTLRLLAHPLSFETSSSSSIFASTRSHVDDDEDCITK